MISSVPPPIGPRRASRSGALDPVLAHVAVAAVDLQALVGDLDEAALGDELRHRHLADAVLALVEEAQGVVGQRARPPRLEVAISATLWRIAWNLPIGRPNASRSCA